MGDGVSIVVTMERDGSISVNGPLTNPILCYGLLESGKDAVRRYMAEQNEKRIIAPPQGLALIDGGKVTEVPV